MPDMSAAGLLELIRKRHAGPAWIVIPEVANGTGSNVSRHADAVALGIWPSQNYEIHGYETKISREDVKKELGDPSKADSIGKYCDYWWLVVSDLTIIDGIVVPASWGILVPKSGVLRVNRKAPKREAKEITRAFAAAMIRKVVGSWVPREEHNAFKENAKAEARKEIEAERRYQQEDAALEVEQLRASIKRFAEVSGVDLLANSIYGPSSWEVQDIASAVKLVRELRMHRGHAGKEVVDIIRGQLHHAERAITSHENAIGAARARVFELQTMLDSLEGPLPPAIPELPE